MMERLKGLLVPSGQVVYRGGLDQLINEVAWNGGYELPGQRFRCVLAWPEGDVTFVRLNIWGAHRIGFKFDCEYEKSGSEVRCSYRVKPTWVGYVLLLTVVLSLVSLSVVPAGDRETLVAMVLFAMSFLWLFLYARYRCVRRFLGWFGK